MEEFSLDRLVHRLARTPLSKRRRFIRFSSRFCEPATTKPMGLPEALAPFLRDKPRIVKGDPPRVEMEVDVQIVGGLKERLGQRRLAHLFPELDAKQLQRLHNIEPEVLEWLAGSDERAARFLADPLGTLSKSELEIDQDLLDSLGEVRERCYKELPVLPLRIKSLRVTAKGS
jgi:hypothetical protein